jgi:hypothetical protein
MSQDWTGKRVREPLMSKQLAVVDRGALELLPKPTNHDRCFKTRLCSQPLIGDFIDDCTLIFTCRLASQISINIAVYL